MVRLSNLALLAWACDATPTFTTPIKHFVVTMMENRPPDHMLGCAARAGLLPPEAGPARRGGAARAAWCPPAGGDGGGGTDRPGMGSVSR